MAILIFLGYSAALVAVGYYFGSRKRNKPYDDVGALLKREKRRKKKRKL